MLIARGALAPYVVAASQSVWDVNSRAWLHSQITIHCVLSNISWPSMPVDGASLLRRCSARSGVTVTHASDLPSCTCASSGTRTPLEAIRINARTMSNRR